LFSIGGGLLFKIFFSVLSITLHAAELTSLDQVVQKTLERSLPRLACNLSATKESKYPVLQARGEKLEALKIHPAPGSILGAASKRNPDYYFVWMRDSSLTADALIQFLASQPGTQNRERLKRFLIDYVAFTEKVQNNGSQRGVNDPRCNIDGSVDFIQWSRPQRDGPALQSLTLLRLYQLADADLPGANKEQIKRVTKRNLDSIASQVHEKSYDPWEYVFGTHFYVRLVQLGALEEGLRVFGSNSVWQSAVKELETLLNGHWSKAKHSYVSTTEPVMDWRGNGIPIPGDGLDMSMMLGVLHARRSEDRFSIQDERVHSTAGELEKIFRKLYPINSDGKEPAMGRFRGDDYYGGNPWFVTTLAEAEFYFRRAKLANPKEQAQLMARGDQFLNRVLEIIPANGMIGEQFDMKTGRPVSSHDMSWSYSSLLTAALAREQVLDPTRPTHLNLKLVDFRCPQSRK
jgi:glucoamylase